MSSINRPAHCLIKEKTLAIPRHLLFFDTETKTIEAKNGGRTQILKLGVSCYWRRTYGRHIQKVEWQDFYSPDVFWDFLLERCERKHRFGVLHVTFLLILRY